MKLRVYRTFHWELDCSSSEVLMGGTNPMKLVASDELQQFKEGEWVPVEVVEEPKPPYPNRRFV